MNLRTARGEVSIRELAERTGISKSTLHRIDSGERPANPAEEILLLSALGVGTSNGNSGLAQASSLPPAPVQAEEQSKPRNEQYPGAPSDPAGRRAFFQARTERMAGNEKMRPPDGTTHGKGVPKK